MSSGYWCKFACSLVAIAPACTGYFNDLGKYTSVNKHIAVKQYKLLITDLQVETESVSKTNCKYLVSKWKQLTCQSCQHTSDHREKDRSFYSKDQNVVSLRFCQREWHVKFGFSEKNMICLMFYIWYSFIFCCIFIVFWNFKTCKNNFFVDVLYVCIYYVESSVNTL